MAPGHAYAPRLPRVPFRRTIVIAFGSRVSALKAANLSLGGMFIEDEQPPIVGERIAVSLETEQEALPLGDGEVVWRSSGSDPGHSLPLAPHGFGLRFLLLRPTARSLVEAVVRHGGISTAASSTLPKEAPTKPDSLDPEPPTKPTIH
jgi:hypothetical protein